MITTREAPLTETGPAGQALLLSQGLRGWRTAILHAISFPPPLLPSFLLFLFFLPSFFFLLSLSLPPSLSFPLSLFLSLSPPKVFLTSELPCQREPIPSSLYSAINSWRDLEAGAPQFWVTVFPSIKLKGCIFHLSVSFQIQ